MCHLSAPPRRLFIDIRSVGGPEGFQPGRLGVHVIGVDVEMDTRRCVVVQSLELNDDPAAEGPHAAQPSTSVTVEKRGDSRMGET